VAVAHHDIIFICNKTTKPLDRDHTPNFKIKENINIFDLRRQNVLLIKAH
jgi:hypothetical protein